MHIAFSFLRLITNFAYIDFENEISSIYLFYDIAFIYNPVLRS